MPDRNATNHGEGAAVSPPGDPASPAYARIPPDARRGMVVIHEIFGPMPEIRRVVDRFAAAGYAAVAPDLFFQGRLACVRRIVGALRSGADIPAIRQAGRARDWLCAQAGLSADRVGIIGFCIGGGFALLAGPGFAAVSTNYGDIPATAAMRGIGPVIGCYGGRDRIFRGNAALLRDRLAPLGVTPEVHMFPTVGHSFLTDGDHPVARVLLRPVMPIDHDAAIAEDAWARIFAFFDRQL